MLRLLAVLVGWLPFRALARGGALLGWVAGSLLRIRRGHVEASMRRAGVEGVGRSARAMYASLGTGLLELLWMGARPTEDLSSKIVFAEGVREALARCQALGRGVVVAAAHTGNWDLVGCAAAQLTPLAVVTKRLSIGSLDRYWQGTRASRGVRLLMAEGASSEVLAALRRGEAVALLVDQAPERHRGFVVLPFLGQVARCDLTPALLAARARAPMLLALGRRLEDGRHLVEVPLVLEPPTKPSRSWALDATARLQTALEAFVLRHPDQWLWLHRRWKLAGDAAGLQEPSLPSSSGLASSRSASSSDASAPASLSSQTESAK